MSTKTKPKPASRRDVAKEVTDAILAELDADRVPWQKPWTDHGAHRNAQSGKPYRGINQILVGIKAQAKGWEDPRWTTFNAAKKAGGMVRKGERGTMVTFWKSFEVEDKDTKEKRSIPFLRAYTVFNVAQVDGLELPELEKPEPVEPIAAGDAVMGGYLLDGGRVPPPRLGYGGNQAYYSPANDHIQLPPRDSFVSANRFYGVAFHEMIHSTGHSSRLARPEITGTSQFGGADYSREELVAEIGSAMLLGHAGIEPDYPQSASYIDGWRRALGRDAKLILGAAGKAQKAADYVLGVSTGGER